MRNLSHDGAVDSSGTHGWTTSSSPRVHLASDSFHWSWPTGSSSFRAGRPAKLLPKTGRPEFLYHVRPTQLLLLARASDEILPMRASGEPPRSGSSMTPLAAASCDPPATRPMILLVCGSAGSSRRRRIDDSRTRLARSSQDGVDEVPPKDAGSR